MRLSAWLSAWTLPLLFLPTLALAAPLAPPVEEVRRQLSLGDVEAAVEAGEEAIEQRADDPYAWFWAGRAYGRQAMEANMLTKAKWAGRTRDAWLKAIELKPDLIDARFDLMQYYLQAPGFLGGGRDKADAEVVQIAKLSASMGKLAEGVLAQADEDKAKAEQQYRAALALDPANDRARLTLGGFLQAEKRMDEFKTVWAERVAQDPASPMARYQLGKHAALTGEDLESGLAHLEAFIATGEVPENLSLAAAQWRRGQILEKLQRYPQAEAALQQAASDPGIADYVEADLERVREHIRG